MAGTKLGNKPRSAKFCYHCGRAFRNHVKESRALPQEARIVHFHKHCVKHFDNRLMELMTIRDFIHEGKYKEALDYTKERLLL